MGRTLGSVAAEVRALRQELSQLRDEVDFGGALLRQDVGNKILSLYLRGEGQQEHARLPSATGDSQAHTRRIPARELPRARPVPG